MELKEAIDIIDYTKCGNDEDMLEAQKVFWKQVCNIEIQNKDGTYKSMDKVFQEASRDVRINEV